jgi:signal transduction histidine kinase
VSSRLGPGHALRRGLGSLRWRLTLSYALVTLAAAVTISLATAASRASRGEVSVDRAGIATLLQKDAARASPLLAGTAPAPEAVRFLAVVPSVDELARQSHGHRLAVAVFGASGKLIVADSCTQQQYTGQSTVTCRTAARSLVAAILGDPTGRRIVHLATQGVTDGQPVTGRAAGHGVVAAPVPGAGKQPQGALVAVFQGAVPVTPGQSGLAAFFALWRTTWPTDWVPLALLTLLLGTGIGLVLSRQLVRRLRMMATVVSAWSRGELEVTIPLRGSGELDRFGADLNQMAEQIRNLLNTRTQIAKHEERHRIRRDLHDGIKQELFATSMHLAAAIALLPGEPDGVAGSLTAAQRSTRRARQELDAMLGQHPPPPLASGDLSAAVTEITQRFEGETGIHVAQQMPPRLQLSEPVEEAMFRVIQEALTNIQRHADATRVSVELTAGADTLRLLVEDNGRGFPASGEDIVGLGLTGMRERVESLGGRFAIETTGTGTRIKITVPADAA